MSQVTEGVCVATSTVCAATLTQLCAHKLEYRERAVMSGGMEASVKLAFLKCAPLAGDAEGDYCARCHMRE
eukprot:8631688-Pyramimonas_sp.AAC.1